MVLLLPAVALADDCPRIDEQVQAALSALDQAELDAARQHAARGYSALSCQGEVVPSHALLELYWVDGLIALAQSDNKGVVYATLRAVAADHLGGRPPDRYGPELQASFDTWLGRLKTEIITIQVADGGKAWVDGRPVDAEHPLQVLEGEHLLQIPDAGGHFASLVQELTDDFVITTGIPLADPVPAPVPVEPVPDGPGPEGPDWVGPVEPVPAGPVAVRRRPPALVISTVAAAGLGGLALLSGFRSEGSFQASPYFANRYGDCERTQNCYRQARIDAIRQDARNTNLMYATGYAATGIAGGLLVVTIVGIPGR